MYDELVKRLRLAKAVLSKNKDLIALLSDAADAIEDLEFACNRYEKDYKDLCAYLPKWIPVTERLPEKNTWVLAYCKYKGHVVDYLDINELWSYGNVTHWMPLPEPPEEETE